MAVYLNSGFWRELMSGYEVLPWVSVRMGG